MNTLKRLPALLVLLLGGYAQSALAWPTANSAASTQPLGSDCEDLSDIPITYGMQYDLPGSGLPGEIRDIHDVWLSGGCVGCHNETAMGNLQLNDPQLGGYQLVEASSNRDPNVLRVRPTNPEASLLYAQINCTPPPTEQFMPPPDGDLLVRIPRVLRALVYDWIAQGARGFDEDGFPLSDVIFRDGHESQRFQRNVASSR